MRDSLRNHSNGGEQWVTLASVPPRTVHWRVGWLQVRIAKVVRPKATGSQQRAFEVLEPCVVKVTCPVLRGLGGRQRPPGYSACGLRLEEGRLTDRARKGLSSVERLGRLHSRVGREVVAELKVLAEPIRGGSSSSDGWRGRRQGGCAAPQAGAARRCIR